MHSIIFYGSYLVFPFLAGISFFTWKSYEWIYENKIIFAFMALLFILSSLFIYARFIEPQIILTKTHQIEVGFEAKIVILADIHLGVYKDEKFLEHIVEKTNAIKDVDAILIPGDLTYWPQKSLNELFSSLKDLKYPSYAVLGNHDNMNLNAATKNTLITTLRENGVNFIQNEAITIPNTNITLLGLGDNWAHEDDISLIENYSEEDNLIVMTHNPDTTLNYTNSIPDITIAGHSHAGQIRLPIIYKYAIPCTGPFDKDLHETPTGKVFVSPGLGETGLPLRFSMPPTIDIIELQ